MDDLQAIRRLKAGDSSGLETLIARYQNKAVRTACLVTRLEPLAEDVVQDAFIRFYERARYFDETRAFEPYFLRMVVNLALNALEKGKHEVTINDELDTPKLASLLAHAASVEDQAAYAQLRREIAQALDELSPRQRAVVVYRYYLEMSEKEMTDALDIAPGTVKWLLNAARTRLRTLLGSERMSE